MNREMFVRVATMALKQNPGRSPEDQAEAIAVLMDTVAAAIGDTAPAAAPPPVARVAFPAVNPEAIAPIAPEPSLIITSTTMPSPSERRSAEPPPRPAPVAPKARMKVEDLSRLVQERTPDRLVFDVPMEDGRMIRMVYPRNVVSMHNYDSVQLVYSPPSALPSAREAAEVMAVLHVDEVPYDLTAIVKDLTAQAIQSIKPRRPIVEREALPPMGPVKHSGDTYVDPQAGAIQNVFNSMG